MQSYRRGYIINHKRVLRLMRQDNLLCLRKKSFLRTTDSAHPLVSGHALECGHYLAEEVPGVLIAEIETFF